MGWNQLRIKRTSRLLDGIDAGAFFYFAHSYAATGGDRQPMPEASATCSYGSEFVAVAEQQNIFAVQFHPEKSAAAGQQVLKNFLQIAA